MRLLSPLPFRLEECKIDLESAQLELEDAKAQLEEQHSAEESAVQGSIAPIAEQERGEMIQMYPFPLLLIRQT